MGHRRERKATIKGLGLTISRERKESQGGHSLPKKREVEALLLYKGERE